MADTFAEQRPSDGEKRGGEKILNVNIINIIQRWSTVDWDSNTELLDFGFGTRVNIFHLLLKTEEFGDILKY